MHKTKRSVYMLVTRSENYDNQRTGNANIIFIIIAFLTVLYVGSVPGTQTC